MRRLLVAASLAGALGAGSCTLTTATGFQECVTDGQCAGDKACLSGYCIPMPEGCRRHAGAFDDPQRIVFAAALPMTSPGLDGGVDDSETWGLSAMTLAIEEVNQKAGVNGRPFAFFVCNTGREATRIADQVRWLSDELRAPVVLTSGSGQSIAAHEVAQTRGVLIFSATATSPELVPLNETTGLLWRTAPPDTLQGKVLADVLLGSPRYADAGTVGVLYYDDSYGQGLKATIDARLQGKGRTVRTFPFLEADTRTPVQQLAAAAPQASVLVGFPTEVRQILAQAQVTSALRAASGHQWIFTDSAKDPAIVTASTLPEVAGCDGFAPAQGAGQAFPAFRDRFLARFSVDPSNYSFTSHSYDAMYALVLAAAWATGPAGPGLSGAGLVEGLKRTSSGTVYTLAPENIGAMKTALAAGTSIDVEGSSGKLDWSFDAGAPPSPVEQWRIEPDGGFSLVQVHPAPTN